MSTDAKIVSNRETLVKSEKERCSMFNEINASWTIPLWHPGIQFDRNSNYVLIGHSGIPIMEMPWLADGI